MGADVHGRKRRSLVTAMAAASAVAVVGALAAATPAGAAAGTASAGSAAPSAVATSGALVGSSAPSAAKSAAPARTHHSLPLLRPTAGHPSIRAAAAAPSVSSTSMVSAAQSRLVANFDGVNALQNKAAAGFDLEPPDEGLGAGNGYVVNFVNVTGAIYTAHGAVATAPFYLNRFFGEADSSNTSDPRVYFDPASRRWFATILEYDFNTAGTAVTGSRVDLAVSSSANPTGNWRTYRFDTTNPSHSGCPCLADYPILGVDRTNVYISTNEFTADLASFNGAQLYAVSKAQLISGAARANSVLFPNLSVAGTLAYHVQPANSFTASPAEYLMSSLDPNNTFDNRLAVWAVSNENAVTTGHGMPTLSSRVIGSEAYSLPPNAQTPPGFCRGNLCTSGPGAPTTGTVQTDFDAMQEVQYINGQLVGALNTAVNVAGDSGARAGVAWFVVRPVLSGGAVGAATRVVRQGYVAERGEYLLYPHINAGTDGSMAMVFGLGGPGSYLSAAYVTAAPGAGFGSIRLAGAGVTSDNGFTGTKEYGGAGRWGDYSNGELVPGSNTIWLATQYIPNNGDGNANWGNRIFALAMP